MNRIHNSKFAFLDLPTVVSVLSEVAEEPVTSQPSVFDIVCPKCKTPRQAAHIRLRNQGKWKSIRCKPCETSRTSRQWLCVCLSPWHSCPHHAIIGHACGAREQAARTERLASLHVGAQFSCLPVNGTGGAPRGAGPKQHINRKRNKPAFIKQPVSAKRLTVTFETGIPNTFLSAKLAARFSAHVRNAAAILPTQAPVKVSEST